MTRLLSFDPEEWTEDERIYMESNVPLGKRWLMIGRAAIGYGGKLAPKVGDFDADGLMDEDESWHPGRAEAVCPTCQRRCRPLLMRDWRVLSGGWRWVGLDYQEPYTDYLVRHARCGGLMTYTIHSPQ